MAMNLEIREMRPEDLAALDLLYPAAFPDEDLLPLVHALSDAGADVRSMVAMLADEVVGHVMFSACSVVGSEANLSLLGPLAVLPKYQKRGVGSALVNDGLSRLRADGVDAVFVLGDPGYYGRFGFEPTQSVTPPYPMPPEWSEAWQAIWFSETPPVSGTLSVPEPWNKPELWGP